MKLYHERGKHHEETLKLFNLETVDPYYTESVLNALYGNSWHSILITDGRESFHHTFSPSRIGETEYFDIEPLTGYSGPIATTGDGFLSRSLEEYSKFCSDHNIIAELVRFNPYIKNHKAWEGKSPKLDVVIGKPIVYIPLHIEEIKQMGVYSKYCRRDIRRVLGDYEVKYLDKNISDWEIFVDMYSNSMKRVSASSYWSFDDAFFQRMRESDNFRLIGIEGVCNGEKTLVAASVVIHGKPVSYHFLTANIDPAGFTQANKLFIHYIALWMAGSGSDFLCLGGGNTSDPDDPLLFFKQRFSTYYENLPLGFFTHNKKAFDNIVRDAELSGHASENKTTDVEARKIFLSYRINELYRHGRMQPADINI